MPLMTSPTSTADPRGGYRLRPTGPLGPATPATPSPADGAAGRQEEALRNPGPVDIKTAPNPYQTEAYGDAKKFADSLADRSNTSITNAMQRTRDVGAGAQADVAAAAGRRGGAPGSGLAGVLGQRASAENQRQVAKTNADLTDVALGRENAARALEMGGATDIARGQSDMFGKQSDLYLGGRRADLDTARYYADERNSRYDRAARIAEMALRYDATPGGGGSRNPVYGEPGYTGGFAGGGSRAPIAGGGTAPMRSPLGGGGSYTPVPGSNIAGGR